MSKTLKVKVKPGKTLIFPAECVHCSRPVTSRMQLRKRKGRLTRLIDVPLCETCAGELKRRSFQEERLARVSWVAAVAVTLASLIFIILLLPSGLVTWLKVLIALFLSLGIGAAILAMEEKDAGRSRFKGFDLSQRAYRLNSFECNGCPNMCEIRKLEVKGEAPVFYGGRCEKYELERKQKDVGHIPDLFGEREKLLFRFEAENEQLPD